MEMKGEGENKPKGKEKRGTIREMEKKIMEGV